MASFSVWLILIAAFFQIALSDDESVSVEVSSNGDTSTVPNLDIPDAPDVSQSLSAKLDALQQHIATLESTITQQQSLIPSLNTTLDRLVLAASDYGVVYDKSSDRPLLLTASHRHAIPFVMLEATSVRLPKRDAVLKKDRKRGGSRSLGSQ